MEEIFNAIKKLQLTRALLPTPPLPNTTSLYSRILEMVAVYTGNQTKTAKRNGRKMLQTQ
jgi:hypothetical protein